MGNLDYMLWKNAGIFWKKKTQIFLTQDQNGLFDLAGMIELRESESFWRENKQIKREKWKPSNPQFH